MSQKEGDDMPQAEPEIIPPERAADGNRLIPAAGTFSQLVAFLEGGQLDQDVAGELRELVSEMRDSAISHGGKSKGQLTLTLDFMLEGSAFFVTAKTKVKLPEEKRQRSITWATEDGRLTPHAPNQGQLFGVRDVSGSGGFRNI
ncbi:hypothetical protein BSL82_05805 [Tardibacter chloracetimidivorans]|uniref:Uncharacterized protein n=1 Tax=Tardibacter chloracetimidivorans TaxID=1921510 RepID=A0A1L3ZTC8_9SPHN|nr:hypothetical protein [Tardibacter chloracetimidivorans]API58884.1 hypothetical protein BSL82_05805 [Tardibacter chloracetimidivorans]